MTEIKDNTNRWRDNSMYLDQKNQYCENNYTTQRNLQIQCNYSEIEQKILQYVQKHRRPQIAKAILRKKRGAGGIRLTDLRLYYTATVIKTVWFWHKNRKIDQWNMTESPEINSHTDSHFIYEKGGKIIQWRKDNLFNNLFWKNWPDINTCKRMKSEHSLTSYAKKSQTGLKT